MFRVQNEMGGNRFQEPGNEVGVRYDHSVSDLASFFYDLPCSATVLATFPYVSSERRMVIVSKTP